MAQWLWNRMERVSSLRSFLIFLALFGLFSFVFFPMHKKKYGKEAITLDSRLFGFSPGEAKDALAKFDRNELAAYRRQELITDLFFPPVYSLMAAIALVLLARFVRVPRALLLLPFGAAAADYVENLSIASMITRKLAGGENLEPFATIGSAGSRLKHAGLYSLTLLLVGYGLAALWRWRQQR